MTLWSSLFETRISNTTNITRVDKLFKNKSRDLAGLFCGKEYTPLADKKYMPVSFLPYFDNKKIVKLEYRSSSIDKEGNIEFDNFEMKTGAYLRAMLNTFFYFETKF